MKIVTTCYTVSNPRIKRPRLLAMVSDLHNDPWDRIMPELRKAEMILICGDLVNRHTGEYRPALAFLEEILPLAPVLYAPGNHERFMPGRKEYLKRVRKTDVIWLNDRYVRIDDLVIGGTSCSRKRWNGTRLTERMAEEDGFRLLLCHRPEFYRDHVSGADIDLTLCGHAHGGQVRIFGQGLYAPGQGFLPRLTRGIYDNGRMIVGTGVGNGSGLPRVNNPGELILLRLRPGREEVTRDE